MTERFDRKDVRFIAVCLLVIAVGAAITGALFRRAFPEASIEFRVNRTQARVLAEKFLAERGRSPSGARFAGLFSVDEEPKVYLERELGLERASRLYGTVAKVWRWEMRWFRSGVKEEDRVTFTPLGDLAAFEFVSRDDAPGPRPAEAEARGLALAFLASRGLPESSLTHVESSPTSRPNRTDWTFVDEKAGLRMGEATVRYATTVSGGQVAAFREFVHVPESWQRDYQRLRSKNETAGLIATLGFFLTILAMLAVLVRKIVVRDSALEARGGLRPDRIRPVPPLESQRPPPDSVSLRHRELADELPDQPGDLRHPGRDRRWRGNRLRRRGGRADLPRAFLFSALALGTLRLAASARRASSGGSCSDTRWSPSSSRTRRSSTSSPPITAPGRPPTFPTATC